jgi:hypothetical protein
MLTRMKGQKRRENDFKMKVWLFFIMVDNPRAMIRRSLGVMNVSGLKSVVR